MNGQRQRARGGRRRRRKAKDKGQSGAPIEPILIAARRPNSPVILAGAARPRVAASAKPKSTDRAPPVSATNAQNGRRGDAPATPVRRTARIVQLDGKPLDEREIERRRLLQRLLDCEGRSAVSRAAEAYLEAGFEFPEDQEVQLQLLEHFNEDRARAAINVLQVIMAREAPKKRPVFEQRLRRLEEYADELVTREAAATLRRAIRA
jgi:hypothetical protein